MLSSAAFILSTCLMFSGIYAGITLRNIAKEELKAGKNILIALKNLLLVFIWAVFLIGTSYSVISLTITGTFLALTLLRWKLHWTFDFGMILYFFFSLISFFTSVNQGLFFISGALIFLYGFPAGSLIPVKRGMRAMLIAPLRYAHFLIIANALFLAITYTA